jgi:hypothetical protein
MRVFKKIDYSNLAENVDKLFQDENTELYDNIDNEFKKFLSVRRHLLENNLSC